MQDPLIAPEALAGMLEAPDLRVLDATWGPPGSGVDGRGAFAETRIPGAIFFDIDDIADLDDPLPHMLPPPEKFSARMRKAGVGDGAQVVVYDGQGVFGAARVWWSFRAMGARDVRVLDGGLPAWRAAGLPLEDGPPSTRAERHFTARRHSDLVRDYAAMRRIVETGSAQILDARPPGRFEGREPEPRPGLRRGHIPGSINVPFKAVLESDGRMKPAAALEAVFAERGVDLRRPIVTTCGSGVTAAILALALARLGRLDVALYDGAWADWGSRDELPLTAEDDA